MKIVIPYFSKSGHTKRLAQAILAGSEEIITDSALIDVTTMNESDWNNLEKADGIIFGTPTFMGSAAGEFKLFLDETAYKGFWTGHRFVDKMATGFTVATYPSGDKLNTIMQLSIYAAQYGMIWVNNCGLGSKVSGEPNDYNECGSWLGLMATSISDKSKLISEADTAHAKEFGKRFAKCVQRWQRGRIALEANY